MLNWNAQIPLPSGSSFPHKELDFQKATDLLPKLLSFCPLTRGLCSLTHLLVATAHSFTPKCVVRGQSRSACTELSIAFLSPSNSPAPS